MLSSESDSQEPNPSDLHTMLVFFDILELDGEELLWRTYGERRKVLEEVIREVEGFVSWITITTPLLFLCGEVGTRERADEFQVSFMDECSLCSRGGRK